MKDLCRSADERAALGSKVRDLILQHHSGAGWREHLETAIKSLPREHTVLSEITPVRTPAAIHEIWSLFVPQWTMGYENTLEIAADTRPFPGFAAAFDRRSQAGLSRPPGLAQRIAPFQCRHWRCSSMSCCRFCPSPGRAQPFALPSFYVAARCFSECGRKSPN